MSELEEKRKEIIDKLNERYNQYQGEMYENYGIDPYEFAPADPVIYDSVSQANTTPQEDILKKTSDEEAHIEDKTKEYEERLKISKTNTNESSSNRKYIEFPHDLDGEFDYSEFEKSSTEQQIDELLNKKIRSNGKVIGTAKFYKQNYQRLLIAFGAYVLASSIAIVSLTSENRRQRETIKAYEQQFEEQEKQELLNGYVNINGTKLFNDIDVIEYKVKEGDTLSGIVYSYESDPNKAIPIIHSLEREYGAIRKDQVIKIHNVPDEKLEIFGYTTDYTRLNPEIEFNDRIDFLNILVNNMDEDKKLDYGEKVEYLDTAYKLFKLTTPDDTHKFDEILAQTVDLCEELEEKTGYKFENNKRPHKLSETLEKTYIANV